MSEAKWPTQVENFPEGGPWHSCCGDEIVSGPDLAIEAFGDIAKQPDSMCTAFAYLWRRFGPPALGSDDHKRLCDYYLTTSEPDVMLLLSLSGCGVYLSVGYACRDSVRNEYQRPMLDWFDRLKEWWKANHEVPEDAREADEAFLSLTFDEDFMRRGVEAIGKSPRRTRPENWRDDTGVRRRVNQALFDCLTELLRPVFIRDCPINLFGRIDENSPFFMEPAKHSDLAGYGVPVDVMRERMAEWDAEG